jgi:hypothetical protein
MATDELLQKQQENLKAQIEAAEERRKKIPPSWRLGPNQKLEHAAGEMGVSAYKRLKHGRWYALDPVAKLELGAEAVACMQLKRNVVNDFEQLSTILPGWIQYRPEVPTIPELPIDRVTGLRIRNPWLEPHDFKSQAYIKELSKRLADWLEKCAKNGGQPSMAMLAELESERADAEYIAKLAYGEKQWSENKLRKDSGATLTEIGQFVKNIGDPYLEKFHRKEAELGSPRLHFDNLTYRMAIAKADFALRETHKLAGEIFATWQAEQTETKAA